MFKIESYITPILLSYVDKYVRDFKPADAQVSLWGGGVALHNLVLKADVLQQEVALPFTLVSGRIHELLIQVPWTKIMSEPIVVTIDTIECILSLRSPTPGDESPPPESPSRKGQVVEAPPGYMQALVRRIVSNIALKVHHLIVKYVQDDIVLSLNVKHLSVDSAGVNWEPSFADIDQNQPVIRRLVQLDDLTLCLDHCDSDGKIRFYQEPLLYRCQLNLKVLTRLVSANTRRASSLSVHLQSSKLAWGVTSDQLTLLLRLLREHSAVEVKSSPPAPKTSTLSQTSPLHTTSPNSAEPNRTESWSDWAWSWLPTWKDGESGVEEAPIPANPTPIYFSAYLDDVSLVFKVLEQDIGRKRARGVLEVNASHAGIKTAMCAPTLQNVKVGVRTLTMKSQGKCVCGHVDFNCYNEEPTIYLSRTETIEGGDEWTWPEENFNEIKLDEVINEENDEPERVSTQSDRMESSSIHTSNAPSVEGNSNKQNIDDLWIKMAPLVFFEYSHERSPAVAYTNPYDSPLTDFQYSDWGEQCEISITLRPTELRVSMGLIHRLTALRDIFRETPAASNVELPMRTLTVEECDALLDNLPQRRFNVTVKDLRVRICPWDHSLTERPLTPPLVLDIEVPRANVVVLAPLYPHRVCSAACQMPEDSGPLWQGARLHVSGVFSSIQAMIYSPANAQKKPCGRIDLKFVTYLLLHREFFTRRESVIFSYSLKIREANLSGSAARLQAASQIPLSLWYHKVSVGLKHSTLPTDALNDEESVALDITLEDLAVRGYVTKNVNTHILSLQSARATALHAPVGGTLRQAWLFSAPDVPNTSPYMRVAVQWCRELTPTSLDYLGAWTEPIAICVDPLFITWLAYQPRLKPMTESIPHLVPSRNISSTQFFMRRRVTPPQSSSGRGGSRSGSGAEVHVRPRSVESSSEPSEKKETKPSLPNTQPVKPKGEWWDSDNMLQIHHRLRHMLINVEMGLMQVYVTMSTASAVDCATVRLAMERHASALQDVLIISVGRWSMHSSSMMKHIWQEIKHDGPTFIAPRLEKTESVDESFPWKMRIADVSCYTLEARASTEKSGREKSTGGLRSQLKISHAVHTQTVLELVSTTVTWSVVTKSLQYKTLVKKPEYKKQEINKDEQRMKYFTSGSDFRPTTLKEFVRGPERRKKTTAEQTEPMPPPSMEPEHKISSGPMVSLGVHVHADTPPIIVRLEHDQVHMVAATLHCFKHILTLLQREPLVLPRSVSSTLLSHKSLIRSVSELDEQQSQTESTPSENKSDFIPIFQAHPENIEIKIRTFFWFQWVLSRATLVVTAYQVKMAFEIDDIISTIDLQEHYNQFKTKVASASIRHYERTGSDEWKAGVLGGRILEAREPTNVKEENHFLAITITQAQISNLPASWKDEMHPKLLLNKLASDTMWEIYVSLAPLEAVLQPTVLESIMSVANELAPRTCCPLQTEVKRNTAWQWPFCYVTAGGLRLLIASGRQDKEADDTFIILLGKIEANPYPENPIFRRPINSNAETGWATVGGGYEGRQYEVLITHVGIRSAQFQQLVNQEVSEVELFKGVSGENPARTWSQPVVLPVITPILHSMDIGCVLAPALYSGDTITCGTGVEFNLMTDCAIELSLDQFILLDRVYVEMCRSIKRHFDSTIFDDERRGMCAYASLLMHPENIETSTIDVLIGEDAIKNSEKVASAHDARMDLNRTSAMNADVGRLDTTSPNYSKVDTVSAVISVVDTANADPSRVDDVSRSEDSPLDPDRVEVSNIKASLIDASHDRPGDSGVETVASHSTMKSNRKDYTPINVKKRVSVAFVDRQLAETFEYLEVFITVGTIELSLYTVDDKSPEVTALKPESNPCRTSNSPPANISEPDIEESKAPSKVEEETMITKSRSLTENIRNVDIGKTKLDIANVMPHARKYEGNVPLIHVTLQQPNLYYWRKKTQKSVQISLFNAWVGLGAGLSDEHWHAVLMSTARGVPDPVTEIPPALATMKFVMPSTGSTTLSCGSTPSSRGNLRLDIERPVLFEICADRLRRLKGITELLLKKLSQRHNIYPTSEHLPLLYQIRQFMVTHSVETATVETSQVGISGIEGTTGWDSASLQAVWSSRPDRMMARVLLGSVLVTVGPPQDARHVVLQPLQVGIEMEAVWESWLRVECGLPPSEPIVRVGIELDRVMVDLRPSDLAALNNITQSLTELQSKDSAPAAPKISAESLYRLRNDYMRRYSSCNLDHHRLSVNSVDDEPRDHHYTDDLRSGAFKIVNGGQLPMAYQVTLHRDTVSWQYPYPRAITRITVFPLVGQNEETQCVLALYNHNLARWEPHSYINIPVLEPREVHLCAAPPEATFSTTWRLRVYSSTEKEHPREFNMNKYLSKPDPTMSDYQLDSEGTKNVKDVTAEQLLGILRVDSYFAPRALPLVRLSVSFSSLEIHAHNSLLSLSSQATTLEGYYVTKPLMRSHRVLTISARDTTIQSQLGSPAGTLILLNTNLSSDLLDCATGTMEPLVNQFRVQAALSLPENCVELSRLRFRTSSIHATLHVPRIQTLYALGVDWQTAYAQHIEETSSNNMEGVELIPEEMLTKREVAAAAALALQGRVSLWLHNSCSVALRGGQEGTDEVIPLGPGARVAYRWRNPTSTKKLRFAFATPSLEWHWSNSIYFTPGDCRIRLEDQLIPGGKEHPTAGLPIYVKVEQIGANRHMHLSGRLSLANMLRLGVVYKVRARYLDSNAWRSLSSGELAPETVGRSVICSVNCEMVLKLKFMNHDTGWSGDIPLKECPKENVPWLVKVPSDGEVPYISVWCRVVRARSDGRILATVWPLYVLHSYLPLDTDVLTVTDIKSLPPEIAREEGPLPPLIQTAPGRGTITHLLTPGTTSAKHSLSFQYRNIECPVTRESVSLHYGATDTSVFDKRTPVNNIDEVTEDIYAWLKRSGRGAVSAWPYSIVSKHWPGTWQPALLQPRCDVSVRYQAVRAGGGCSLELQLSPVMLLCNASPIALTLRAHDAAPLCKLEPGVAISPSSAMLQKPFFLSVEMGRETFVSGQLEVSSSDPGRYGSPPPGQVAIDHSSNFAIQCNQKVALLTMHYEIKEDINVIGITSTFLLINNLDTDLMVSAIAIPCDVERDLTLRPKTFKVVRPTKEGSLHGIPICRFWLRDRWRGGDASELNSFVCLALPEEAYPASAAVPVRLASTPEPARRAVALVDSDNKSVPIVITQQKHEGRWLVSVARDPCPQFVVHNRTQTALAIAQPLNPGDEPSASNTKAVTECEGVRWWCTLEMDAVKHYSSPAFCGRHPTSSESSTPMPFLTFARDTEDSDPEWCPPVAVADGEQLVQLSRSVTVKLRVRTYPHSTLIELQDVDSNDISASDIRRRLIQPIPSTETISPDNAHVNWSVINPLERVSADNELLQRSEKLHSAPKLTEDDKNSENKSNVRVNSATNLSLKESKKASNISSHKNDSKKDLHFELADDEQTDLEEYSKEIEKENYINRRSADSQCSSVSGPRVSISSLTIAHREDSPESCSFYFKDEAESVWDESSTSGLERVRCVVESIAVEMSAAGDVLPLLALHVDRAVLLATSRSKNTKATISIADIQIDNLQYDNGLFDFAVVATTRAEPAAGDPWPALWNMFGERAAFHTRQDDARLLIKTCHDQWTVVSYTYRELTELDVRIGPLSLYVEDAYLTAIVELCQLALPFTRGNDEDCPLAETRSLQRPLRLRLLHIQPMDLTLTLHTAMRVYIALDQSPLHLGAFKLRNMMTSTERLVHALTVHYLSAAILGAGWVVGGLELLGAPGALAARLGGARGGVRGIASAAAAALLRSLSTCAGSLARNLDLLAGDEEHARRAAAARRRPPDSFIGGLVAGFTNFAINILGAVGGLAHHPLVGVAIGESGSGAMALRRGILGALTKPLSATADLVAYAGHGLLRQTGWDPVPQPRTTWVQRESATASWRRDSVRWTFRLAELSALVGFEVLLDNSPLQLLLTHKFLVVADPESERIVEMIELRFCTLSPYRGAIIEIYVTQRRVSKVPDTRGSDDDDDIHVSAAAMARVARYTGAEGSTTGELRILSLLPAQQQSLALYAALAVAIHHNADTHFPLL